MDSWVSAPEAKAIRLNLCHLKVAFDAQSVLSSLLEQVQLQPERLSVWRHKQTKYFQTSP